MSSITTGGRFTQSRNILTIQLKQKALNPTIVEARNGKGRKLTKLEGKQLRQVDRKTNRSKVLDLICRRGNFTFRVVRRWFAVSVSLDLVITHI